MNKKRRSFRSTTGLFSIIHSFKKHGLSRVEIENGLKDIFREYKRAIEWHEACNNQEDVIVRCLIEFFGFDEKKAREESARRRISDGVYFCHDDALDSASSIAGIYEFEELKEIQQKNEKRYIEILDGV